MPDENGRTIHSWLQHIDRKLDTINDRLDSKADSKRVEKLEERTRHTELKQAGIAGAMTAVGLWIKHTIIGS